MKTENAMIDLRLTNIEKELGLIKQLLQQSLDKKPTKSQVPEADGDIINVNEAMHFLKMDRHILYEKCGNGDLPCFRVGKQYKFRKEELQEWLDAQKGAEQTNVDDYVTQYLQKNPVRG